jgi:hypothetical protein
MLICVFDFVFVWFDDSKMAFPLAEEKRSLHEPLFGRHEMKFSFCLMKVTAPRDSFFRHQLSSISSLLKDCFQPQKPVRHRALNPYI